MPNLLAQITIKVPLNFSLDDLNLIAQVYLARLL